MGRKRTPGLYKRKGHWHIDKKIFGRRLCESTGTGKLEEAERYLARRLEEVRQANVYGVRPKRMFKEAATKFLMENQHKHSIRSDASCLKMLVEYIGDLPLESVHMGTLQDFIKERRQRDQVKARTINYGLQVVRRILNLAASEWIDEHGLTWLLNAPKIKLLPLDDARKPYPISWEEQDKLFRELPQHLKDMALFAVNTGCRDQEVCQLRWEWEVKLSGLAVPVFIIPAEWVKNKEDRLVVCNDAAASVIESVRGKRLTYVFGYQQDSPMFQMNTGAWQRARRRVGLEHVCVHDLKHTFGRRLRAAGVSFEDRQDLLGHRSARITTHYSHAELENLYLAANKVCYSRQDGIVMTLLRPARSRRGKANNLELASFCGVH